MSFSPAPHHGCFWPRAREHHPNHPDSGLSKTGRGRSQGRPVTAGSTNSCVARHHARPYPNQRGGCPMSDEKTMERLLDELEELRREKRPPAGPGGPGGPAGEHVAQLLGVGSARHGVPGLALIRPPAVRYPGNTNPRRGRQSVHFRPPGRDTKRPDRSGTAPRDRAGNPPVNRIPGQGLPRQPNDNIGGAGSHGPKRPCP